MARRTEPAAGVWSLAEEVPRAGLPDAERLARRMRTYRIVVWSSVILTPLMCLVLFVSLAPDPETPVETTEMFSSDGRNRATVALRQWLDGEPPPLPGGKMLSWDGSTKIEVPEQDSHANTGVPPVTSVEHFTLIDNFGRLYRSEVFVRVDDLSGPYVVDAPSLTPLPAETDMPPGSEPWPGRNSNGNISDDVRTAVTMWAEAFTSGDSNTLRLAVGDPSSDHGYLPLVGVEDVAAKVTAAAWWDEEESVLIARVSLGVHWASDPDASTTTTSTTVGGGDGSALISYDVRIERADTASPVVVAWGVPGGGFRLERYENAERIGDGSPDLPTTTTTQRSRGSNATSTTAGEDG